MIDYFVGEIRLVVENQCDVVLAGNIFGGDDGEFIPGMRSDRLTALLWERLGRVRMLSGR